MAKEPMKIRSNEGLRDLYEQVYREGHKDFFSRYVAGTDLSENDQIVLGAADWQDKTVLDVGCGSGRTISLIATAGARQAIGIDYAASAIAEARSKHQSPNLTFHCTSLKEWRSPVDLIVSCGAIEHTDSPLETLRMMESLIPRGGQIILTCPHFLNIRGFIWMTLQTLLGVPMSLSDLHFISPFDVQSWLQNTALRLVRQDTFDKSKANGSLMLTDLQKRLSNALRDAGLDNSRVDEFIKWLEKVVRYQSEIAALTLDGATALYVLEKVDELVPNKRAS
jgi:2-polyprenyl-3-methyl-5-hydroxy-6-metoxy-1,4-benzoquinol methylase